MNGNNGELGQDMAPISNGADIKSAAKGLFDGLKTPVFWIAVGFVVAKFMDRKRILKV